MIIIGWILEEDDKDKGAIGKRKVIIGYKVGYGMLGTCIVALMQGNEKLPHRRG